MLTKYEDIKKCVSDTSTLISSVKAVVPSDPRGTRRPSLNTDTPVHTPYRIATDRTLKASRLKRLEPILGEHARREFQKVVDRGHSNVSTEFGAIFAAWVEVTWLNNEEDSTPNKEDVRFHSEKLYDMARALFGKRRENVRDPETDPASSLLGERVNGEPISEENLIDTLRQCLVVGMVTPPILFANIAAHLARDKALQQQLREEPRLIPSAVEEFVRLYVPYCGFCRTASHSIPLHDRKMNPGEPITMTYAAANRDPEVFADPNELC
ncbi:cytochrome P450 [Lophiotrema nucula]|uniref:Cytochrome P450 n=1 Tax=Lophiotrema nucula TaxID=690887 RepID=A0A6A5YLT6_9PLEO|nr:cytochrome P450 [Lophiotrema nucula]